MKPNKPRWVYSDTEQDKWLDGPFVIIGDPTYYMKHELEVTSWLDDNVPEWTVEGVVIRFTDRDQMTMFKLRFDHGCDGYDQ